MSRLSCILSALFLFGAGALLGGCSTTLATRAPRGVDLSGEWQIDLPLSDFPQAAVPTQSGIPGSADTAGGRRGRGRGMGGGLAQGGGPGGGTFAGSPERHFAMPPHLSISQSATVLTVNVTSQDGKRTTSSYTAGEKSVVTTTRGPANRTVGWEGDEFLIRTQVGDKGPESEVRYSLDRDGTLSVISTITHSGIYDFQYTLEYDHVRP
ncbi:MAG TPA: hypothetical protein VGV09_05195 [Steroidobacteraceae bacterium]|nr:hypothetical protein [Steroidobacteraceae bacterium]